MKRLLCVLAACVPAEYEPTVPKPDPTPRPEPTIPGRVANLDFDGDGLADLAFAGVDAPEPICKTGKYGTSCHTPNDAPVHEIIAVYLGRDRGKLSQQIVIATRRYDEDRTTGYVQRIGAVGDLDGDGRAELALLFPLRAAQQLVLLRGDARGLATTPYQRIDLPKRPDSAQWYNLDPVAAGDVDGDGHRDVVLGDAVLRGAGAGKLAAPAMLQEDSGFKYLRPVGDVDGDGVSDLVAVSAEWDGSSTGAWLVRGGAPLVAALAAGHLALPAPLAVDRVVETADLDGNGTRELVGRRDGRVTIYAWRHGKPAATGSVTVPLEPPSPPSSTGSHYPFGAPHAGGEIHQVAAVGGDLVVVTSSTTVEVPCGGRCFVPAGYALSRIRGGTLSSGAPAQGNVISGADPQPHVLSTGDFDGDGVADLMVRTGGELAIHQSKHGPVLIKGASSTSQRLITIDLDGAVLEP